MNDSGVALFLSAFFMLLIFVGFLIWGIRSGQFRDVESSKYRVLEEPDMTENEKDNGVNGI